MLQFMGDWDWRREEGGSGGKGRTLLPPPLISLELRKCGGNLMLPCQMFTERVWLLFLLPWPLMSLSAARPTLHIYWHYGNHTDKQFGVCMLYLLWHLTMIHIFSRQSSQGLCTNFELLFSFIQLLYCFIRTAKMHVFLNFFFFC